MLSKKRLARKKRLRKARNIVKNNMEKAHVQYIGLTAKTAHKFIKAYSVFQAQRQQLRSARMDYMGKMNKLREEAATK